MVKVKKKKIKKTKLMTVSVSGNMRVRVKGEEVEIVTSFMYLGSIVTVEGAAGEDIQS